MSTLIFQDTDAWKGDIDAYLNPEKIATLAKNTGTSAEELAKLTFYHSCHYFYNQTGKTPQVKWVMPLGVRTKNQSYGLQFCPCCLAEDGKRPYFRKQWRLGFMTCCLAHSVQLHDRCPKCGHYIDLKRLQKQDDEILFHPENISHCSKCGFDLRQSEYVNTSAQEYEINRINFLQATLGYGRAGNLNFCYSNLYFEGVRRLLSFIVGSPKGEKMFMHLRQELGLQQMYHREIIGHNLEPERLSIGLRRTGLIMIYNLLQDWPETFVSVCKKTNMSTHLVKTPYLEFPFWVTDALFFNIQQYKYSACSEEKEKIVAFFTKRLKKKISHDQVGRFIGYYFRH